MQIMLHPLPLLPSPASGGVLLYYQPHAFHAPAVLPAARHYVNARGVDAAVTKDVSQPGDVLFDTVEHPREQVAEIVRKHLLRIHTRFSANALHFPPDARPVYGSPGSRNKDCTLPDPVHGNIMQKLLSQVAYYKDASRLSFK